MERTIDSVIGYFSQSVSEGQKLAPASWVEAAQYIVVLMDKEHDTLYDLQQKTAQEKVSYIEDGDSVAKAKAKVEASDTYKQYLKQKARIEQLWEFIRTAKLRARLEEGSYRNQ